MAHKPYQPGMTLMPGDSTSVGIGIELPEGAQMAQGEFHLVEVPPPTKAPIQSRAETLGLLPGLRAEKSDHQFRCAECNNMQPAGAEMVWVPDGVMKWDPAWSVTERARQGAFNGSASGWCLSCAKAIGRPGVVDALMEKDETGFPAFAIGAFLALVVIIAFAIFMFARG